MNNNLKINTKERINKYSEKMIKNLIELRKNMLNPSEEFMQDQFYLLYAKALKEGQTKNVAIKTVLDKSINSYGLQGKFIKTLGGFIALGLAIKPIDNFVENVLIGKFLAPGLEKTKKSA
jgi:hypothetical protein